VIASAALTLSLAACGGSSGAGSSSATIKVGVLESLSGDLAAIGQAELDGYKSAVAYINANGGLNGKQIELDVLDDANDPAQAVTQVRKLFADKIKVLLGPVSSTVINAVEPLVQAQKIPNMVGGTLLPSALKTVPHTLAFVFPATAEAPAMLAYAKKNNFKKIAFMNTDTPTQVQWMAAWQAAGGTSVDTEVFNNKGTDFTANAARVKASGADLVVLLIGGTQTGIALSNLQSVGYTGQIASYQGILSLPVATVEKLAGAPLVQTVVASGAASQALGAGLPAGDPRLAENKLFGEWFKKTTGSDPNEPGFSGLAWDALRVLSQAVKDDPKSLTDSTAWNTAMHSVKGFAGANATYNLTSDSVYAVGPSDVTLLKVSGGAWHIYNG
jgi:branched-chain amino acid transport system substrate-binding protein